MQLDKLGGQQQSLSYILFLLKDKVNSEENKTSYKSKTYLNYFYVCIFSFKYYQ